MSKEKFTATMVRNDDKRFVQSLRDKYDLGEKELMNIILSKLVPNEIDTLDGYVAAFKTEIEAQKQNALEQKRLAKELVKQAKADARAARKAEKASNKETKTEIAVAA